jgi:hypothetical protein
MAFVQLDSWDLATAPGAGRSWTVPVSLRRPAACAFTISVHLVLLWLLVNHLAQGVAVEPAREDRLTIFNVAPPGASDDILPAGGRPAAAAQTAATASLVDLSRPMDLPEPEWSVASIRVPRPSAFSSASLAGTAADGSGNGRGGAPRLKQFVGFGDGIGGELLLDKAMLEAARQAAVSGFPGARGSALIFLRVSPSGTVTAAVIKGGSRDIGSAFRRELIGKKLFLVRSAIAESAFVALPPVSLGTDT